MPTAPTKEQLIQKLQSQLTRVQNDPLAPPWVAKWLQRHIDQIQAGVPITKAQRLADMREQLADVQADPKAPQQIRDSLAAQIAALEAAQ